MNQKSDVIQLEYGITSCARFKYIHSHLPTSNFGKCLIITLQI